METSYDNLMAQKGFLPYRMGYLTDWMKKVAEEELNETEETRKQGLLELKKLVENEKGLKIWMDDAHLLQFLRARKFNVKRAWDLLHHFYTVKRDYSDVYPIHLDIEFIRNFLSENDPGGPFPYRDKNGAAVGYFKPRKWDPDQFPITTALSILTFALIAAIDDPATQVCGAQVIVDAKGFTLKHLRNIPPRYIKLIASALRNTLPLRIKSVHIVNESVFLTYIVNFLKLFLTEKIKNRFHFHGNDMKSLHKHIPKEILPPEYEGENTDYCEIEFNKKEWLPSLEKYKELHRMGFC